LVSGCPSNVKLNLQVALYDHNARQTDRQTNIMAIARQFVLFLERVTKLLTYVSNFLIVECL